jgi:hypothetical protein
VARRRVADTDHAVTEGVGVAKTVPVTELVGSELR